MSDYTHATMKARIAYALNYCRNMLFDVCLLTNTYKGVRVNTNPPLKQG